MTLSIVSCASQTSYPAWFRYRTTGASGRKKVFRLSDVVQPLSDGQIEMLTSKAVKRILQSEKAIAQSGMSHVSDHRMVYFFVFFPNDWVVSICCGRSEWSCSPGSWRSSRGWWKKTCSDLFWTTSGRGATWPFLSSTKSTTLTSASCRLGCWTATTTVCTLCCRACRRNPSRGTGETKYSSLSHFISLALI